MPDEEIVRLILKTGNNQLFSSLYNRYYSKVYKKCHGLVKDKTIASEFANDIMTKAFEKLPGFKQDAMFGTWLYSITYNHCIDYLREKKKLHYPNWNKENVIAEFYEQPQEDFTDLHFARLAKILAMLHIEEKAMLLMKYQDDLSIKEIAAAMRLSEGAVKMRIKRSKARILYLYKKLYGNSS
ncbi:MAG TPA: RNA polymerase sigma factor [Bacteroidales bacterium]|nr:RNA polymerase sigma factor [Bacteroidales bacterium]